MIVTQANNVFECTLWQCLVMLIGNDWHRPAKNVCNVLYV
jgi:hypothetical protein